MTQSWAVLRSGSLAVLPILSVVAAVITLALVWMPLAVIFGVWSLLDGYQWLVVGGALLTLFLIAIVNVFFNAALALCVASSPETQHISVRDSLSATARLIGPVLGLAAVNSTIGTFVTMTRGQSLFSADIARRLTGATWDVARFFAIPVLALERTPPWASLRRSVQLAKTRWGGRTAITDSVWLVPDLTVVATAAVGAASIWGMSRQGVTTLGLVAAVAGITTAIVVNLVVRALRTIFRTAVYQYALTGQADPAFDETLLRSAFELKW